MDIRKYSSPLGRDIGTSKATKGRGWKGLKGQMALALAVSLWIGGGVALADEHETVTANKTVSTDESGKEYLLDGDINAAKGKGITFTVENGGTVKSISGNDIFAKSSGNTVTVKSGGEVNAGSNSVAIIGGFCNNEVTVEGTVTGRVYGGENVGDVSTHNHVVVTGTVSGAVYGGYADTATNNTVEIRDAHVGGVTGGAGSRTTDNTVVLHNATVDGNGDVYGGTKELDVTGNTLIVSGKNTVEGNVARFKTIKLASDLEWDGTNAVLTAASYIKGSSESSIALDISEAAALKNRTESGTMTLIKSNGSLAYFSLSDTVVTTDGVTIQSTAKTAGTDGVTIGYNNTHSVVRDDTNKAINYVVANSPVNNITLGEIAWNAGGTVFNGTGYDFNTNTVSWGLDNIKNLTFTFANEAAYKSLAPNATMTLISNATGIHGASAGPNPTFDYKVANGAALNTKVWGQLYVGGDPSPSYEDTLTYKIDYVDIESVNLADWDSTKAVFSVPDGWIKKNLGNESVPVTAAGFTAPTLTAGQSKDIITTNTTNFFSDDKITGALKYAAQAASTDTANGVALTGSESKGVKASDDGKNLVYARSNFEVSGISLGTITWNKGGTARELTAGDYTFNDSTAIDTSSFEFNTPSYIGAGESMTLIGNATGLTAGDSIAHSQSYTNYDNCIKLNATLTGNITRTTNTLGYTATGTTLDSVDLANWNGTTTAVPAGWGSNLGANSIKAAGFAAPDVAAGESTNILTTTTNNFFNDNQITGAMKYKADAASSDTTNGVTLTGAESKGVKASDDGKNLVYARSNFNVSDITFGEMTWGTSRDASGTGYDYSNAAVNMDGLTFSNPEAVSDATITLLKANSTFTKVISETTKNISYGYSPVDGVTVDGIINGSYKTDSNAIKYTATANNATKLTFGNVAWKDSGALINHATTLSNVSFDGAAVDTSNIYFTNIKSIEDNKQMTLVSDFGTSVGTISGTSFGIGTEKGEGHAFYENNNLRYLVTKGIGNSQASSTESVSGQTETVGNEAKVNFSVIGAMTGSGRAESNKATVSDKSEVTGNVVGAETTSGVVDKNEANVTGNSQINGNVEAAKTNSGSATANTANVESSKVTGSTVGAVTDNGLAIGNVASVTSGSVGTDVAGAQSTSGTVSNGNTAKVQSAEVGGSVYGGKSTSGEVNSSIANVSGGSVKGSVYGGSTDGAQKAEKNEVKLENDAKVQKDVYGGHSGQGIATGNKVTIDGATVAGTVYGGKSQDKSDNNSIVLDNGTVGTIIGGGCEEASGNTVSINDGEVLKGVYGAKAGTSATNNTVTMAGGKVNDVLYGGYADSATGITTGNTVTLYGTADVSNAGVFGGNGSDITGNILNIGTIINDVAHSWSGGGQSVKNVANFKTMNFVSVPWNKEKAAVTISDGTASDLSGTKINATTVHFTDTTSLKQGDTMTLLDEQKVAADKRVQAGNITKESKYTAGSTLKGTGILSMDDSGNVIYKVTDKDSSDQSHNTVMGVTSSMAALSAGNDFVGSAVEGLGDSNNAGSDGLATYAKMGGGSMNVETGSHVKTHTWNAILALGHKNEKKLSTTEYGAFFEYGTGNYSTFNGDERGDGSNRYTGGGILGKWQKNNGFYVEGSLRAGSIHDDANNVLRDYERNPYSYNTDSTYWGAHIGVGREIKLNKTAVLDLYAKYFYNHRGSVSFDAGGHYDLGAVESSVLRVGTRYAVKQNDNINYYGGLAVEHEFCGRASGLADGVAIRGADISGTSVRGEIGATFRPGEKNNVTLDLYLSGFVGKKQGFTGGLSAVFHI